MILSSHTEIFTSFWLGHISQSYKAVKLTSFFLVVLYKNELSKLVFSSLISEESQR